MHGFLGAKGMLHLAKDFPALSLPPTKTSDHTQSYNCIAWAFGDSLKRWWPNVRGYHWPVDAKGLSDLEAFTALLSTWGWRTSSDRVVQFGLKKLALYALNGQPKHMARQLASGVWTSKLGDNIDIAHQLEELEGPCYGRVLHVFEKPVSDTST
jgi:hypothetical protein